MHDLGSSPPIESRLAVRGPQREYAVVLGRGLLGRLGELTARAGLGRKVVVATDTNVAPLYGRSVLSTLRTAGFEPSLLAMPAGEAHKTLASANLFVEGFLDAGLDRSGWVLSLGGGVVGDTAGFATSIYMRGVPLVQVPTTILAMADSSIGSKVGVDHARGKNLLGAFKEPHLVVIDLDTLASLPPPEMACGMAEIIKAGIIGDAALFQIIEACGPGSIDYANALLKAIIVKRDIVQRDPYEAGERAHLNLGHTFGHAFEKCSGYARSHGCAVAQGMVVAFRLAEDLGMCDGAERTRLENVLTSWALPIRWGAPDLQHHRALEQVREAMSADKKRQDGKLRLVLPEKIGQVRLVSDVPESAIERALAEMQ